MGARWRLPVLARVSAEWRVEAEAGWQAASRRSAPVTWP